jgi:hypothetical protein
MEDSRHVSILWEEEQHRRAVDLGGDVVLSRLF